MCYRGPFPFVLFQIVLNTSDNSVNINHLQTLGGEAAVSIKDKSLCWRDWWGRVNVLVLLDVFQSYVSSVDYNQAAGRFDHPKRALSGVAERFCGSCRGGHFRCERCEDLIPVKHCTACCERVLEINFSFIGRSADFSRRQSSSAKTALRTIGVVCRGTEGLFELERRLFRRIDLFVDADLNCVGDVVTARGLRTGGLGSRRRGKIRGKPSNF